jgi:hypothetical protein
MKRIVAISDTHQLHDRITDIPEGDILVHCGDFTNRGTEKALTEFLDWFTALPHAYKVFIPGNHEEGLDKGPGRPKRLELINKYLKAHPNLTYLENSWEYVNGIKFYGSPVTPWFFNWAWNVDRGPAIAAVWEQIPDDVEVLITHGPPYGILDLVLARHADGRDPHQGCQDLLNRVNDLKNLKLHLFGHLHLQGGQQTVVNGVTFGNAAICDDDYRTVHAPVVVEI